ncbi:biotin-dependent carboxyltransferase family protein [Mycobacterium sp. 21AC1]|uniref:5-oxoprolinase subunit C family protein n=1 Tax=[Mycobacterium] appelbergii TaxID=2939269 RepID=UPI0029393210|nr:biotin-dependent carboxyltransferase family protein [Mycobacterium sp. 21AC1]MDV3130262.1 biotin-dependent carboxyltransferase family protein [Mycobacterium sp. 21AC1]
MFDVIVPGVQTLVQDRGRMGYFAIGLPPSGPMDYLSHHAANALVGNDPAAAALESVFIGPTVHFRRDTVVAVTGAEVDLRIDEVRMPTWTTLPVRAGQVLTVGPMLTGARSYLAVRGGVGTPKVMGSRSTYLPSGIGGVDGRELRAGDVLRCADEYGPHPRLGYSVDEALRPALAAHQEIRVVLGLCRYRFTDVSVEKMLSSDFAIGIEANRVGYRLSGPPLEFVDRAAPFGAGDDPSNVVDLGYPVGSIQVPSGQELICLLRDGVTGGGYATIGTVIGVDIDLLAQMQAPNTVRLVEVGIDDAVAARRARDATIAAIYRSAELT